MCEMGQREEENGSNLLLFFCNTLFETVLGRGGLTIAVSAVVPIPYFHYHCVRSL